MDTLFSEKLRKNIEGSFHCRFQLQSTYSCYLTQGKGKKSKDGKGSARSSRSNSPTPGQSATAAGGANDASQVQIINHANSQGK